MLNEIFTLEIGGDAVRLFEKNEKFWGIKIKKIEIIKKK